MPVTDQIGKKRNSGDFAGSVLVDRLEAKSRNVKRKIDEVSAQGEDFNVGDMLKLQMLTNECGQLTEAASGYISATNNALGSVARKLSR